LEAVQRLYSHDTARASGMVDDMKKLVRSSMDALRRSLANLRTEGLSGRPLVQALRECCDETQKRSGIAIGFVAAGGMPAFNAAVSEALWHVARESLLNIEKHSGAQTAQIRLESTRDGACLRVVDDGRGLPENAEHIPGHYGLRGMRERLEGLGGSLTLSSASPRGASVEARAPLADAPVPVTENTKS
jgi:signal transduction histidine kinase